LGTEAGNSELVAYVQAFALRGLGRLDEALVEAERSMELNPNGPARQLLDQILAEIESRQASGL
jgi:hypothetical protein